MMSVKTIKGSFPPDWAHSVFLYVPSASGSSVGGRRALPLRSFFLILCGSADKLLRFLALLPVHEEGPSFSHLPRLSVCVIECL